MNYKHVERLHRLEQLYIRRRRHPVGDRQQLVRKSRQRSLFDGLVCDRVASDRTIKSLVIIDGATHEAVAVVVEHTLGGKHLVWLLDGIWSQSGSPAVIRTDRREFVDKAMLT